MIYSIKTLILSILLTGLIFGTILAANRGLSVNIRDRSGKQVGMYEKSHALLIGVSDYTAGWPDLETIPSELKKVESILKQQGFTVDKVLNPDSRALKRSYEDFIYKYGYNTNDRLLFFFSGHGYSRKNGKKGYLVPTDAPDPNKDKKGFLRKALNMSQIITWSRQMESKHALFLFDSCFSGAIFKTKALPKTPPHISAYTARPVRQYITAGSAGEEVPASSVFTPSFVRALEGEADLNRDGYITGTEMGMYLNEKVMYYNRQQTPQYGKIKDPDLDRGDFVFVNPISAGGTGFSSGQKPSGTMGAQVAGGAIQSQTTGKGRIKVTSQPGQAEIYIDNIFSGTSPLDIPIKPGIYAVEARKSGYNSESKRIRVFEGQDLALTLILDKAGSSLYITSDPSGADVHIDNAYSGQTPLSLKGLNPGTRLSIKMIKEGYQDWTQTVAIQNSNQNLQATLNRKQTAPADMVLIPAGEFPMGSEEGDSDETPVHRVYLDAYYIDKHEVTVAEYEKCVNSGACGSPNRQDTSKYGKYCNWGDQSRSNHPVNCIDWNNAVKYCGYAGKRLPTEAEWEKAATWKNGRKFKYPSGKNSVSCTDAVMINSNTWKDWETKGGCDRVSTWSVGSKPEEINGTYDMAGNVWEWVADWYGNYSGNKQRNPKGPSTGFLRVNRGGSWNDGASGLRGAGRSSSDPSRRDDNLGFRCARSPK